ncbi:MAG: L,D-transpeptidase [Akkermansiaceae bacterium]
MIKFLQCILPAFLAACLLNSCGIGPKTPNPDQVKPIKAVYVNPFPQGTYEHFLAVKGYPRNYGIWKDEAVLASTNGSNSRITIDLSDQRGYLYNGDQLAMNYPVSTGQKKYRTPTGSYKILERIQSDKRSNTYGKIYDAEGKVVKSDADARVDTVPEGGRYEGALMAYWMRLTWDGIGMHRGRVPRYPASHGCIRTYSKVVPIVFAKTRTGTPVVIQE